MTWTRFTFRSPAIYLPASQNNTSTLALCEYIIAFHTCLQNIWVLLYCCTASILSSIAGNSIPCCHHHVASSPHHNFETAVRCDQPSLKPALFFTGRLLDSPSLNTLFSAPSSPSRATSHLQFVSMMDVLSKMTGIKAGRLPPSTLPHVPLESLCMDFVNGFCRRGEKCLKSHEICVIPSESTLAPRLDAQENLLSLDPRAIPPNKRLFDDDGPGALSKYGPRHDNDHVEIKDISILPTTDEILCRRLPYMPRKDPYTDHRHYCGQERLLDTHFRHLRYENTEPIIDACYDASQRLSRLVSEPNVLDYDDRMVTAKGFRYSLFRDVAFEEITFDAQKGVSLRLSFACPKGLRGSRLETTKHLEGGMLVALIGLDDKNGLSSIFMEIWQRQSTNAMRPRTGNDLRGEFLSNPP